jgi:predicted amidohydrolase YtcJ
MLGSLAPGQWADFLLIDRDISGIAPADIAATRIDEHWIAGKRVYKSGEAAPDAKASGNK